MAQAAIDVIISAKDNASAAIKGVTKTAEEASKGLANSSNTLSRFAGSAKTAFSDIANGIEGLATKALLLTAGGAFGAKYFIDLVVCV